MSHNEWILGRMMGAGLLRFLRMLLRCKICAFRNSFDPPRLGVAEPLMNIVTLQHPFFLFLGKHTRVSPFDTYYLYYPGLAEGICIQF